MKRMISGSFRQRLLRAFLVASLVPLLICSAMMQQIYRLRLSSAAQTQGEEHLDAAAQAVEELHRSIRDCVETLEGDSLVLRGIYDGDVRDLVVNNRLYQASEALRGYADVDLYDIAGLWRYSAQTAQARQALPTNWGLLRQAARSQGVAYTTGGAGALQGAALLTDRYGAPMGYVVFSVSQSQFQTLFSGKVGAQNALLVLSSFWRPVYSTQPEGAEAWAGRMRRALLDGRDPETISEEDLYRIARQPDTGLYLVLRQPQALTRGSMRLMLSVSLFSAMTCVLLSLLMSLRFSRQLFRPIDRLHRAFRRVGRNDLEVQVPVDSRDELGELGQQFNTMVVDLRRNQQQLVENEHALNEAQTRMLQAQLNPHFLCNTLDTMKWIGKLEQVPQVAIIATDLADILRFCIGPAEFVPLRREVGIVQRYIEIQRIRLSDSFTFQVQIPEEVEDCLVPKMILQPLVENAILHGVTDLDHGEICLTAEAADGVLRISVSDNGKGLPPELLGAYRDHGAPEGHLGLFNVDTILQKHYGNQYGLLLANREQGAGAVITAALPAIRQEERNAEGTSGGGRGNDPQGDRADH